jgi:hypothetical protein
LFLIGCVEYSSNTSLMSFSTTFIIG